MTAPTTAERDAIEQIADPLDRFIATMAPDPYHCPTLIGLPAFTDDHPPTMITIELAEPGASIDPVEAMLGFEAPPHWHAVAFCGSGTGHALGKPATDAEASRLAGRLRMIHGVRRDGSWTSFVRTDAGETMQKSGSGAPDPLGHIDDVLRRVLGLPTAPPCIGAVHLWAGIWLSMVRGALDHPELDDRPTWSEIEALHPARLGRTALGEALGDDEAGVAALDGLDLVEAGHRWASDHDWDRLRTSDTLWRDTEPPPFARFGHWLDTGSFSRLAMVGAAPLCRRLELIEETAGARWGRPFARRLRADLEVMLEAWQLDVYQDPSIPPMMR